MLLRVLDRSMQAHGAAGISQDFPLAHFYASARTLRYADGPDEVHRNQLGRNEVKRAAEIADRLKAQMAKSEDLISKL